MEQQRRITMLLVEDDRNASEIICSMLEMFFPQARIYSAGDGQAGLDCFQAHLPDIVITDINMPDMDGVKMLDRIYAVKPDTRVIVITAHSDRRNLDRINSVCASALMVPKPIDFECLFKSARHCIDSLPHA